MDAHQRIRGIGRRARRINARLRSANRARNNAKRGLHFGASFASAAPPDRLAPNSLERYFDEHQEGPGVWKWRHYFNIYERHFARFVGQEIHLLEIGIYSGGSIELWRHYFGEGLRFYGVDLEPACRVYEASDARIFIGDQADPAFWQRTLAQIPRLDIVVDDGGHRDFQQIATLEAVLPRLAPGGCYLCEDIHGIGNAFHAYINGMARNLHAVGATVDDGSVPAASERISAGGPLNQRLSIRGGHRAPRRGVGHTRGAQARLAMATVLRMTPADPGVTTLGRTRLSSRRNTSIPSRSPAQRLAKAASASCDSASDRNVASVSSRPCQRLRTSRTIRLLELGP